MQQPVTLVMNVTGYSNEKLKEDQTHLTPLGLVRRRPPLFYNNITMDPENMQPIFN